MPPRPSSSTISYFPIFFTVKEFAVDYAKYIIPVRVSRQTTCQSP
jgi:hypothetical protein